MNRDDEIFARGVIGALCLSIVDALSLELDATMVARWVEGPVCMTPAPGWCWP